MADLWESCTPLRKRRSTTVMNKSSRCDVDLLGADPGVSLGLKAVAGGPVLTGLGTGRRRCWPPPLASSDGLTASRHRRWGARTYYSRGI